MNQLKTQNPKRQSERLNQLKTQNSKLKTSNDMDFWDHRLQEAIRQLFGDLDEATLTGIRAFFDWVDVPGGTFLVRQGDEGDCMYVLASGRLKVQRKHSSGRMDNLGEISNGEPVGEMALITGEPRSADILAMRDSVMARLSKAGFDELVHLYPKALMNISKTIINRFKRSTGAKRAKKRIVNLCVLPISTTIDAAAFTQELCAALRTHGDVFFLDSPTVNTILQQADIAQSTHSENEAYRRLTSWLEEQEINHRFVVYLPDQDDTEWTRRCLRQADEILLLGDSAAAPQLHPLETRYLHGPVRLTIAGQTLAILHPPNQKQPSGTAAWLAQRELTFHHHLRRQNSGDLARLARFLSGNAVGLVLSGGAAKGFAHIGIFRALEEAGLPVDIVGGTSIGAVIGALIAQGHTGAAIRDECREIFKKNPTSDFNLVPRVSIFKGKKLEAMLEEKFGNQQIEDCWLNFFCVSCNLTRTNPHTHTSGSVADALRASISIPGVFPPALFLNDLYVDGGVFNNMPVDVMTQLGAGSITAVDLQMYRQENEIESDRKRKLPNLLFVVMESSMLSGRYLAQEYKNEVDLYFNPPLRGFSLIDWNKFDVIESIGYQHAKAVLALRGQE